jgi:hypothetical protein
MQSQKIIFLNVKPSETYEITAAAGFFLDNAYKRPDERKRHYFTKAFEQSLVLFVHTITTPETGDPRNYFNFDRPRIGKTLAQYDAVLFTNIPSDGSLASIKAVTSSGVEERYRLFRTSEGWVAVGVRKSSAFNAADIDLQERFSRSFRTSQMMMSIIK